MCSNIKFLFTQVKFRIAVGLSKEGRAITRNLLTLLAMNAMCILFFNYTFKEFSIIALVGLLCDFFLQLVFFPTVLSIDLRRLEVNSSIFYIIAIIVCTVNNSTYDFSLSHVIGFYFHYVAKWLKLHCCTCAREWISRDWAKLSKSISFCHSP